MVILISLLLSIAFKDTTPDYEQLAVNHFFGSLITQKYPNLKSVEFASKTDTSIYFGIVNNCTQWDDKTKKAIFSQSPDGPKELVLPESTILIKKIRDRSARLKIYVSSRKKTGDTYLVQIVAYKKLRFVDHIFYQFDSNGRLIDTCEKNEII